MLLLVQIVVPGDRIARSGPENLFGPRDEGRVSKVSSPDACLGALHDLLETYPAFMAMDWPLWSPGRQANLRGRRLAVAVWRESSTSSLRRGIPVVRTLVWAASIVGLVMMLMG